MKVLFDARVHLNYFSGISRYIICLLESYAELFPQDEVVVLINPTIQSDNAIYKVLGRFSNVRIDTIRTAHMGPKNYLVMGRIVKKYKPDVYHYPHLDAPIFTGKIPVVATIHDTNSNDKIKKFDDRFGLKSLYFRKSLAWTLRYAQRVIFVSDSIKTEVLNDFSKNTEDHKYKRIYNGLESDFNNTGIQQTAEVLKKHGVSGKFLLYVGQIREHKNIHRLLEAFAKFQQHNQDYTLVLIGHNYLNKNLQGSSVKHIEKVSNKELKAFYAACHAFLFPSLFEGFGFPILEAFAFGKNVVTTNYGATKEISGELAVLVDPNSVDAIVIGIERAVESDDLSEARKLHASKFTWQDNAKQVREVYIQAVAEGK